MAGSPKAGYLVSRAIVTATWDDCPHLTDAIKKDLYDGIARLHPHQVESRTKGVPSLGIGAIYPFDEATIRVDPFKIPKHWKRAFALDGDAGSGQTAIVWGALDLDGNKAYITDCYKSGARELSLHVDALRQRGLGSARELLADIGQSPDGPLKQYEFWIPGVGDAKNLLVTEYDSRQVIELYRAAGVNISYPDKAVEAGIGQVYEMFVTQRLKVFSTCSAFFAERRLYRRNAKSAIVKKDDHVMDAVRYLVRSGFARAKMFVEVLPKKKTELVYDMGQHGTGWMQTLLLAAAGLGWM